jgi:DNA anti-recombination protein RmuC
MILTSILKNRGFTRAGVSARKARSLRRVIATPDGNEYTGRQSVVIDAKVSLTAFEAYVGQV